MRSSTLALRERSNSPYASRTVVANATQASIIGLWRLALDQLTAPHVLPKPQRFTKRRIGFGPRPLTWQGWVLTAALIATAVVTLNVMRDATGYAIFVAALVAYLVVALVLGGTQAQRTHRPSGVATMGAPWIIERTMI